MPVDKFRFIIEVSLDELFEFVKKRNEGVEMQAYGTPPKQKHLEAPKTLALPAPVKRKKGAQDSLLIFLAMKPKESCSTAGLRAMLMQQGYSEHTLNNAIWTLRVSGLVRATARGHYRVTPKGLRIAEELSNG